jgi:hypothetical protein
MCWELVVDFGLCACLLNCRHLADGVTASFDQRVCVGRYVSVQQLVAGPSMRHSFGLIGCGKC